MATVLLIEDEITMRRVLTRNLLHRGHTVLEAQDMAEARDTLRAMRDAARLIDVIVLDVNLPDAASWELLRRLHVMCAGADIRAGARVIALDIRRPAPRPCGDAQADDLEVPVASDAPVALLRRLTTRLFGRMRAQVTP